MKRCKHLITAAIVLIFSASIVKAVVKDNIQYAKEHLIILVHGIGDDQKCFENVKYYLDKTLGLEGYVYMYQFSNPFLNIEKEGWEFGDRTYDNPGTVGKSDDNVDNAVKNPQLKQPWEITKRENNGLIGTGKSWLEQAKTDFKIEYARTHGIADYKNVPDSFVPKKFIVIAHSMGGLAVRSYIYGKDHNGQRFYNNDIEKVIYIDTPHLGSTAGKASIWAENNRAGRYLIPIGLLIFATYPVVSSNQALADLVTANCSYALAGSGLSDSALWLLNRLKTPALEDMSPNSRFLNYINNVDLGNYDPINQHIIVGRGVPTPSNLQQGNLEAYFFNLAVPIRISASIMNAIAESELETWEEKMQSINLTCISGYPFFEDGDLVITRTSQKGEGIGNLSNAKIHEYLNRSRLIAEIEPIANTLLITSYFIPKPANVLFVIGALMFDVSILATDNDPREYILSHVTMKDKIVLDQGLLDQALFEPPAPGSNGLNSVHTMGFDMLTNISTTESSPNTPIATSSFHPVEVKGFTEAGAGRSGFPIVIGGQEKNIEAFTVKEAPTRIDGVLRDFMPLKMQYFQYSENFAAWKDIPILDEYGRFSIDGLRLAEGQNVIAFRAKNKVGYTSNQILNITVNTIPLLPSGFTPAPNSFTNNNQPEFSVNFAKSSYSASSLESVSLTRAILRNETTGTDTDITNDVQTTPSGGTYDKRLKVIYKPTNPLDDGKYSILVVVNSNVGIAQALWGVTIDTKAPAIAMEPLKPYSPKASSFGNLTIKYSVSDEASACLGSSICLLYDQSGAYITKIATDENITAGEHYFNWKGGVPDRDYIVKIKSFDLAGNFAVAETPLTIDSTPPEITGPKITPKVIASKNKEMKLEASVSEKAQVFIKMTEIFTNAVNVYLGSAANNALAYSWMFGNSFIPGPKDGIYNIELTARDEAGNMSNPLTIEAYRIDRTPRKFYGVTTLPYVLSNSGKNPYKTKLRYWLSEEDKAIGNREEGREILKKKGIKTYDEQ